MLCLLHCQQSKYFPRQKDKLRGPFFFSLFFFTRIKCFEITRASCHDDNADWSISHLPLFRKKNTQETIRLSVRAAASPCPEDSADFSPASRQISDKVSAPGDSRFPRRRRRKRGRRGTSSRWPGSRCGQLTALCRHSLSSISLLFLCSFRSVFAFPAVGKWC